MGHKSSFQRVVKLFLFCYRHFWGACSCVIKTFVDENRMRWIAYFTSARNRHVLPLFTSLLNVVGAYDPVGYGIPYNYLLFADTREPLVQTALQVLTVCLDSETQSQDKVFIKLIRIPGIWDYHVEQELSITINFAAEWICGQLFHKLFIANTQRRRFWLHSQGHDAPSRKSSDGNIFA